MRGDQQAVLQDLREQIRNEITADPAHYLRIVAYNRSPQAVLAAHHIPGLAKWRFADHFVWGLMWVQLVLALVVLWQAVATDWRSVFALPVLVVIYLVLNLARTYMNIEMSARLVAHEMSSA